MGLKCPSSTAWLRHPACQPNLILSKWDSNWGEYGGATSSSAWNAFQQSVAKCRSRIVWELWGWLLERSFFWLQSFAILFRILVAQTWLLSLALLNCSLIQLNTLRQEDWWKDKTARRQLPPTVLRLCVSWVEACKATKTRHVNNHRHKCEFMRDSCTQYDPSCAPVEIHSWWYLAAPT